MGTPDNLWSIVEDKTGCYWLGSYGNGLFTLDKNKILKRIDLSKKLSPNLYNANNLIYMASTTDNNRNVFITTSEGLVRFTDGKLDKVAFAPGCLYSFFDSQTKEVMYSGTDTATQCRGLYVGMDNATRKFYPFDKGAPVCIVRDGNAVVRVGSYRGSGRLVNDQLVADTAKRPYMAVVSMALDNKNRLWKATEKGVYVELKNGQEYRVSEKLLTGAFTALIVYKNKYLVAGGTHGIAIVDIEKNISHAHRRAISIGYESGFTGLESGQNGICIDSQGFVWLTTALNVLRFNPELIANSFFQFRPSPRILEIAYSSDNKNWNNQFFSQTKVVIDSDCEFLRIHFVANAISAPHLLRFRYRLLGLSDKWSEAVYVKSVNYTNINYGKYRFEVQSSMDGIDWSAVVQSPVIQITAPFYLHTVAFLFYLLLIVALSILITHKVIKTNQLKQLQVLNGIRLENEMKLNTLRSKIIPHFSKNVLSAIGYFAMTDKLKAGHYISIFSKFNALTLQNADKNYIAIKDELEYITQYIELEKMRFEDRFEFSMQVSESINTDNYILTMALHTYCDNAIRHGLIPKEGPGMLRVEVTKVQNGVLFAVIDNGVGRMRATELGTKGNGQGLKLIQAQIDFYNLKNDRQITQTIIDLYDDNGMAGGSQVELFIPDNYQFA